MTRLLFVDDEDRVLDGLQRMLRPMRHEWDMRFVTSGVVALQSLAQTPFDVVVSDMRMPGMDGAQFLREVQARFPQVVRMVLSGHSDQNMIEQSRNATHLYLAKPCPPEVLKATITRVCHLKALLADEGLRGLVAGMSNVPTSPLLYRELTRELATASPSMKTITAIIAKDLGMTAKILQIVNSTYADRCDLVATAAQATSLLGLDTICSMVRIEGGCSVLTDRAGACLNFERLWEKSLETGALARVIAQAEQASPQMVDQAGTAGLLHEIGALILAGHATERFTEALSLSKEHRLPLWVAEQQVFGNTHAEVGGYLLGLWGLSEPIVTAVAYHHAPSRYTESGFCPLTAVHVADSLQRELASTAYVDAPAQLDMAYLSRLGLTERLPAWREAAAAWRKEHAHE